MWESRKSAVHAAIEKNFEIAEEIGSITFIEISSHLKTITGQWEDIYGHSLTRKPPQSSLDQRTLTPLSRRWLLEDFVAEMKQYHFYLDRVMSDYLNMMHSSRIAQPAPRS